MRSRLVAAVTLAALATLPAVASGAPARPQIRDPKGDARGGLAQVDIVTAQWSTTGRGASKALVATLTLAGAPNTERGFAYEMKSEVTGCGTVWFEYAPGTVSEATNLLGNPEVNDGLGASSLWLECGGDGGTTTGSMLVYREMTFSVKGNVITWSVPLTALPEQVQPGAVFSDFKAIADVAEPVMGLSTTGGFGQGLDFGQGDGVWIMR